MRPSVNWPPALVPVTLALEHAGAPAPWLFFAAAVAIVPVARLIVRSTERLAIYTGDAVGGLLNATFGDAPELIIALVALRASWYAPRRSSWPSSRWCSTSSRRVDERVGEPPRRLPAQRSMRGLVAVLARQEKRRW